MYRKNNQPSQLAAYQEKKRMEQMMQQQQFSYDDDIEDDEPTYARGKKVSLVKTRAPRIDKKVIKEKLNEAQMELLMLQEKQKEVKRLINRLNKELI